MPFYEYQCKSCGHELEAMQKVSDEPLKKCPHCGKSQLQRLMSAPVFRLKGGGWYETDFKGDQDSKRNLADRPEAENSKNTDEVTETKTDAKAGAAKGNESKPGEGKTSEGSSGTDPKTKEKSQKSAEKTPSQSAKPAGKKALTRASRPMRKSTVRSKPAKKSMKRGR
jgi:putative FmdB family regulatory protein